MPLTTAGRNYIASRIVSDTDDPLDATTGHLGVGDSSTAFDVSQTNLQAASNKLRKVVDSAPNLSTNVITMVATFGSGDANWVWNEWCVANHVTAGTMVTRKVDSLGTKSGGIWVFTATITVAIGS